MLMCTKLQCCWVCEGLEVTMGTLTEDSLRSLRMAGWPLSDGHSLRCTKLHQTSRCVSVGLIAAPLKFTVNPQAPIAKVPGHLTGLLIPESPLLHPFLPPEPAWFFTTVPLVPMATQGSLIGVGGRRHV